MTNRRLCTEVSHDGLKCGDTWPKCVNVMRCAFRGECFWRAWHSIPKDKMRENSSRETSAK